MLGEKLEFEGLTGVGHVQLDLEPNQHIYTFIGENGIGKTKTLEALFQVAFMSNQLQLKSDDTFLSSAVRFSMLSVNKIKVSIPKENHWTTFSSTFPAEMYHSYPVVFIGAQSRGILKHSQSNSIREGANKRGNSSRLTQSFHFFMFEPIFSPVNALNQPI